MILKAHGTLTAEKHVILRYVQQNEETALGKVFVFTFEPSFLYMSIVKNTFENPGESFIVKPL